MRGYATATLPTLRGAPKALLAKDELSDGALVETCAIVVGDPLPPGYRGWGCCQAEEEPATEAAAGAADGEGKGSR